MNEFKGILASAVSISSAVTAWATAIELALRIIVSIVGIIAGVYAARYWHRRTQLLNEKKEETYE